MISGQVGSDCRYHLKRKKNQYCKKCGDVWLIQHLWQLGTSRQRAPCSLGFSTTAVPAQWGNAVHPPFYGFSQFPHSNSCYASTDELWQKAAGGEPLQQLSIMQTRIRSANKIKMWNKGDWGISLPLFLPPSSTPSLLKILRLQRKNRAPVPHMPQTSFPFYFLESKNCRERIWRKFRKRAGFQNHVLFHWLEVVSVYSSVKLCSFYNQKHFKLYCYINSHPVTQQGVSTREISLRKSRSSWPRSDTILMVQARSERSHISMSTVTRWFHGVPVPRSHTRPAARPEVISRPQQLPAASFASRCLTFRAVGITLTSEKLSAAGYCKNKLWPKKMRSLCSVGTGLWWLFICHVS